MAWAAVASAAVSVGGSLLAGSNSSSAAGDAASAQAQSSEAAIAEQRRQFDLSRSDTAPYRATGVAANSRLSYLLGLGNPDGSAPSMDNVASAISSALPFYDKGDSKKTVADFLQYANVLKGNPALMDQWGWSPEQKAAVDSLLPQAQAASSGQGGSSSDFGSLTRKFSTADLNADPVYQSGLKFGLDQGTNAINARAIASGGYDSGATLKALTQFGNDYGSTKANDSYNRYTADNTNTYNKLAGVSGAGQNAVNTVTTAGTNSANNIGNLQTGIGNANAAGIVGGANAWGSAAGSVNSAVNNYQSNQTLQALLAKNGSGNYSGYQYPGQYSTSNVQYG